jgi:hypothetical protein
VGDDFEFTGTHVERPLSYYGQPAPGGGTLVIGFPEEYTRRMP